MRLFIYFFAVILIGVSSVGLISYSKSKQIIEKKVSDSNRQTVFQISGKLNLIFENYESLSVQALLIPEFAELVSESRLTNKVTIEQIELRRKVEARLQSYMHADKNIGGIFLIPLDDKLLPFYSYVVEPETLKKTDWFQKVIDAEGKGVWVPTFAKGPAGSQPQPAFGFARLVKDTSTFTPNYVMLIELKESILQEAGSTSLTAEEAMYVLDQDGTIVSSPNAELIGSKLPVELKPDENKGSSSVQRVDGEDMLISHQIVSKNGWQMVGTIPYRTLVNETNEIFNLTIVMAIVGALAAVLIGWFVALRIGRPLQQMSGLMRQAEAGDLSVRSPHTGRTDEIGKLAQSFNEMIGNIRGLVEQTSRSAEEVLRTASELADSSRKTAASASEIATATEQIASGAGNLAVEAEKGTDLTLQMGERMRQTIEANVEMASAAAEVQNSSVQGSRHMQEMSEKTSATEELTRSMVRKVEDLKESTGSIRKILDTLNNMTKQTNILALNATIEAARAGAAGRGFMVVADEIRKLADQSKHNIDSVGEMIERIRKEIEETVLLVSEAYPMFREQIVAVKESNEIFDSVNERMGLFVEQLDAVTESITQLDQTQKSLNEAMTNVSAVAEQSSATSEEVAGLSSEQLAVSQSLVDLSNRLEEVSNALKESLTKFSM
ncbi:methyl-accepting chemotaxis protein [Paenibacillus alkalitolerans]|uniref:methyl-accepting chemotaxis protein n=1 Tax=Paenibacillus alkalitolerans TaxID=2799335 RepID=UPI0018F52CB5|nr:methyl-accepting chemotaxis protein [Paenibacillus alkalitolerans]